MQDCKNNRLEVMESLRLAAIAVGAMLLVVGVSSVSYAQQSAQKTFPSAAAASHALFLAVQSNNVPSVMQILGGEREVISSDDEVEDKADREQFAKKYREMHRLVREPDGATVLYIGAENWPFPIPLMSKAGTWYFDSEAGKQEIVFRRIGANEATAVETCRALIAAKKQQSAGAAGNDPVIQYAQSLTGADSTPFARNGASSGPFHGYYFRQLAGRGKGRSREEGKGSVGGSVFLAYPVAYRSSGVMTFVVTQGDVVYERDLGPKTAKLASTMTAWKRSSSWQAVESQ